MNTQAPKSADQLRTEWLENLDDQYFSPSPDDVAKLQALLATATQHGVKISSNFSLDGSDKSKGIPENFGFYLGGIRKRKEAKGEGMEQLGMFVYTVPTPELLEQTDDGKAYINACILDGYRAKIRLSTLPNAKGQVSPPAYTVEDWIKAKDRGEGYKTFTVLAPIVLNLLRSKGLKTITAPLLRQCLASQEFAFNVFRNAIKPEGWDNLLRTMIDAAGTKNLKIDILQNWLDTRRTVTADEVQDIDLDMAELTSKLEEAPAAPAQVTTATVASQASQASEPAAVTA